MRIRYFNNKEYKFETVDLSYQKTPPEIDVLGDVYCGKSIGIDDSNSDYIFTGDIVYLPKKDMCIYVHENEIGNISLYEFNINYINYYLNGNFEYLIQNKKISSVSLEQLEDGVVISNKYINKSVSEILEDINKSKKPKLKNENKEDDNNTPYYEKENIKFAVNDFLFGKNRKNFEMYVNASLSLTEIIYEEHRKEINFIYTGKVDQKEKTKQKRLHKFCLVPIDLDSTNGYFFGIENMDMKYIKTIKDDNKHFLVFEYF